MKKRIIKTLYRCKSVGPKNNGLLKNCDFQFPFDHTITPHCPQCGEKLELEESPRSVSKLLQEGFAKEQRNK
tara:strand:- start:896 stop:1111 length:216 start_codon:yes stop_codon:yes gene_type:complete